jgi:hypothetical protein
MSATESRKRTSVLQRATKAPIGIPVQQERCNNMLNNVFVWNSRAGKIGPYLAAAGKNAPESRFRTVHDR